MVIIHRSAESQSINVYFLMFSNVKWATLDIQHDIRVKKCGIFMNESIIFISVVCDSEVPH